MEAEGSDRTGRVVRLRPIAVGLIVIAAIAGLFGLATRSSVAGMLMFALLGVIAADVLGARWALASVRLRLSAPAIGTVGETVPFVLDGRGLTQPVIVVRPGAWDGTTQLTIGVRHDGPGTILVDVPHRGVRTHETVDVVAHGPLGLAEAARRERLRLPVPLHVVPRSLRHVVDWKLPATVPLGEATTVTRGDDLFRGVRPYARGDPRRSVHWPATAHHGSLMVKEHDGLEQIALRVVVDLPAPGPAAEAAVARAAWLVEHGLARAWLVLLVTTEGPPPPPLPLGRPWTATAPSMPMAATSTVERRITRLSDARLQLAAAAIGSPALAPWPGLTRVVSPEGDRWS